MKRTLSLRATGSQSWTQARRYAIGPDYLSESIHDDNGESFNAFAEIVERHRSPSSRARKGARSLRACTIDIILENFASIGVEELKGVPKHLVWTFWNEIISRSFLNFHSWKTLSKALDHEPLIPLALLRYREQIKLPEMSLAVYIEPLISKSFDFITYLSIQASFRVPDLVQLTKLANLGVLELIHPDIVDHHSHQNEDDYSNVSDRLLRVWTSVVHELGAFSVLRVLRLHGHNRITDDCFKYTKEFPVLGIFDVRRCGLSQNARQVAEDSSWQVATGDNDSKQQVASHVRRREGYKGNVHLFEEIMPLWDGLKVTRTHCKGELENGVEPKVLYGNLEWCALSEKLFHKYGKVKQHNWELENCRAFARLGELREDRDLIRAGIPRISKGFIDIGDGPELVSSIPIACLQIGVQESPRPVDKFGLSSSSLRRERRLGSNGYTFIRIGVQDAPSHHTDHQHGSGSALGRPLQRKDSHKIGVQTSSKRKVEENGRLRSGKLKKLDNVLHSFMGTGQ